MLKQTVIMLLCLAFCFAGGAALAQSQPCPGYNPNNNVNLACQIPTAVRASTTGGQTLGQLSPTVAAQLSQLPLTTAISGSGFAFSARGTATPVSESLGTILTQRGETLGKNKFFFSFNYQRFNFGSID